MEACTTSVEVSTSSSSLELSKTISTSVDASSTVMKPCCMKTSSTSVEASSTTKSCQYFPESCFYARRNLHLFHGSLRVRNRSMFRGCTWKRFTLKWKLLSKDPREVITEASLKLHSRSKSLFQKSFHYFRRNVWGTAAAST